MALVAFNKFQALVADVHNGVHNLGSNSLKIMLSNVAPVPTNSVLANITEIAAGNGYTAGGTAITVTSSVQVNGVYRLIANNITIVTATASVVGPFRYAVLYNATAAAGNLIGWYDNGSALTLAATDSYGLTFDPVNGLLTDS